MDREQAIIYATNTIRGIEYAEKYNQPKDFDNMIELKDCLMFFVSNSYIENPATSKEEKSNG